MAAFLANVGVNAGHAARSPVFADGTFQLLPIPEATAWRPPMLRLGDLANLRSHAPTKWLDRAVHLDPDFTSPVPTYGDNCRRAGRAFNLRRSQRGDVIFFLARLHTHDRGAGFHLVGRLEIDDVLADVTSDPGPGWWDANAHVRRARATDLWDSFWVFKGGRRSRLFAHAIPFGKRDAQRLLGDTVLWPSHRTELQTIGCYTRAIRRFDDAAEEWLRTTCPS